MVELSSPPPSPKRRLPDTARQPLSLAQYAAYYLKLHVVTYEPTTHSGLLVAGPAVARVYREGFLGGEVGDTLHLFDPHDPGTVPEELTTVQGFELRLQTREIVHVSFIQRYITYANGTPILNQFGQYVMEYVNGHLADGWVHRRLEY